MSAERKLRFATEALGLPMPEKLGDRQRRFLVCAVEQSYLCFLCQKPLGPVGDWLKVSVEHVFPRHRRRALRGLKHRGVDLALNLVAAHSRCNRRKGKRLPTRAELERLAALRCMPLEPLLEVLGLYVDKPRGIVVTACKREASAA